MSRSAFGVEHDPLSKAFTLGSPEALLASAHRAGKHEGAPSRGCTLCQNPKYAPRAARGVEAALKTAKAV